ncbi:MAG: response regulator [Phycisphaerales bacterium]
MSGVPSDPVRVMLVDDEPHVTHIVSRKLQRLGYQTLVARDGAEALSAVGEFRPDVILSDLQMPQMDGLTLAERLAELEPTRETPILMISGRGFLLDEARVRRTNITEVIEKPFSIEAVVERIPRMLAGRTPGSEAA